MRKLILGIAALATFATVSAQRTGNQNVYPEIPALKSNTGFYVDVHGGYNLPIASQTLLVNGDYTGVDDFFDDVQGTYGKGANFGLSLGYMFNQNVGAELGLNYLLGSKFSATEIYGANNNEKYETKGQMFQLSPSVVVRANNNGSALNPYAKAGLLIGVGTKVTDEYTDTFGTNNFYEKREYTGNTAIGFTGALGVDYAINNKLSFFGEVKGNALSYRPEKSEVVVATNNGNDVLGTYSVRNRETEYLDSYIDNGTANQPRRESRISQPFSSVGFNLGLRMKF